MDLLKARGLFWISSTLQVFSYLEKRRKSINRYAPRLNCSFISLFKGLKSGFCSRFDYKSCHGDLSLKVISLPFFGGFLFDVTTIVFCILFFVFLFSKKKICFCFVCFCFFPAFLFTFRGFKEGGYFFYRQ